MQGIIYHGSTQKQIILANAKLSYSMDGSGELNFQTPESVAIYDYIYTDGNYFIVMERTNDNYRALWVPQLLNHVLVTDNYEFEFTFTDTYLSDIIAFLNSILDRPHNKLFQKFTIVNSVPDVKISTTFSKDTIVTALEQLAEMLSCFIVYDNFTVTLTNTLPTNSTQLVRGKNCFVSREYENGLIPTRVFTLGLAEYLPAEYPHKTLTKSVLRASLDSNFQITDISKGDINSITGWENMPTRWEIFALQGIRKVENTYYMDCNAVRYPAEPQFTGYDFVTGDFRISTYARDGGKRIDRVQVYGIDSVYGNSVTFIVAKYDEDGIDIETYNDGTYVVLENCSPKYRPSHFEESNKVSIQKFLDIPIGLPTRHLPKASFVSLEERETVYALTINFHVYTSGLPGVLWWGTLLTNTLTIQTVFSAGEWDQQHGYLTIYFSKNVGGETLSLTLDSLNELYLYGTYVQEDYCNNAVRLNQLGLNSMKRPLKELDMTVLNDAKSLKAGQVVTFEGSQYLVQQTNEQAGRKTVKLSTKSFDTDLKQFLGIYDSQRNMQREYRRRL